MIMYVKGDLFQSPAQVFVNAVNTVGVMGKGIALEFRKLFPDMYKQYRSLCEQGQFKIGMLWLYKSPNKWVLNFPTKTHWRYPSQVEYIEAGLKKFASMFVDLGVPSIAFPALGCGNGQLDFKSQVQPLMEKYLDPLPIDVFVYPEQRSVFIEHLNPDEMRNWLRSEPTSLPFAEVWDDLTELLSSKKNFKTIARGNPFTAHISQTPPELRITASGQTYTLEYDTLVGFWQQLRTHGFSTRHIAPGINKQMSYLISVFAELDYVTPVHISDSYSRLENAVVTGIQVLPSAFARTASDAMQTAQLPLF